MKPERASRTSAFVRWSIAAHLAGAGAVVLNPSLWKTAMTLAVLDHSVLVAGGLFPRSRILGPNITRLDSAAGDSGEVALTFDDGPDPETTPAILDMLDHHRARATFFFIGMAAERYPEIVAATAERGHLVENHTWAHPHGFAFLPPRALRRELESAQALLGRLTGRAPRYLRAPAGIRSPWLQPALARLELRLVSWTRRAFDTRTQDPRRVATRLLRHLAAGDILLLHDGGSARSVQGTPVVLEALPAVLRGIRDQGLTPVGLR